MKRNCGVPLRIDHRTMLKWLSGTVYWEITTSTCKGFKVSVEPEVTQKLFAIEKPAKWFFTKHRHEMASNFWGTRGCPLWPLNGPFSKDLEAPFFRLKLSRTSTLTMPCFTISVQPISIYLQEFCVTNHCVLEQRKE